MRAAFAAGGFVLAGCGAGTTPLQQAATDPTVVGSISPQSVASGDVQKLSDEVTVRNAVSSLDVAKMPGDQVSWANADTGSRGAITTLVESKEDGLLCRKFTTTRESFDGVALYQGKTCMAGPGNWQMLAFQAM